MECVGGNVGCANLDRVYTALYARLMLKHGKPEVMAPAGTFAALTAAIHAGCDSVYFGVSQLNMRARASQNFTLDDVQVIARQCRDAGVRSYVTLNTLLYEHDMQLMRKIMDAAHAAQIDAVIVQDVAAMQYAADIGMPIHASTQLSISNYESVKFFAAFADTIVLARELDLRMVANICRRVEEEQLCGPSGNLVKIEVFVHGALCIAQSGRCQMSLLQNNTSAQRGACLQECRHAYRVIDEENGHEMRVQGSRIFSPKDLCALPFLDQLADAGVSVFKIEGRGRSPQYVDTVVRTYREAVDALHSGDYTSDRVAVWMEELRTVFNRGFTDGWYLGKPLPEWSRTSQNQATDERVFVGTVEKYFPKAKIAQVKIVAQALALDDRIVVMGHTTGVVYENVTSMRREEEALERTERQDLITLPIADRVRTNDKVFLLRDRSSHA